MLVKDFVWRFKLGALVEYMVAAVADYSLRQAWSPVMKENKAMGGYLMVSKNPCLPSSGAAGGWFPSGQLNVATSVLRLHEVYLRKHPLG